MSKNKNQNNTNEAQAQDGQTDALEVKHADQPEITTNQTSQQVIESDQYVFDDYYNGLAQLETSIEDKFAPGFDPTPYHFTWVKYNKHAEAQKRYFTRVSRMLHADWFNPNAFDEITGGIAIGKDKLNDGRPELELFVRTKRADEAEKKAEIERSRRFRGDVPLDETDDEFKAVTSSIAGRLGAGNVMGPGLTGHVGGWK